MGEGNAGGGGTPGAEAPPPDVGVACIPGDEKQTDFAGFSVLELGVETRSAQCDAVCLVNHFQGRVTCPYGQTEEDLQTRPPTDPGRCRGSGAQGVSAAVPQQRLDRPAASTVHCSCRCAGPDPAAAYCACPTGFECFDLIPAFGDADRFAGSYCIDPQFFHFTPGGDTCDAALGNCGDRPQAD